MTETTSPRAGIGGPKTPEGKSRSSMNALKHGLNAKTTTAARTMEERTGIAFEEMLEDIEEHYRPTDPVEYMLVQRIARSLWRLVVASAMEDSVFARYPNSPRPDCACESIMKYERLADIHLHRAMNALARKRHLEHPDSKNV
jgi:hypothetical protein